MQTRWQVGHISNKWARSHKDGAGDRDRTGMASLEGWGSTIELHPHFYAHLGGEPVMQTPRLAVR